MRPALLLLLLLAAAPARAQMDDRAELRYCGEPRRDADGSIHRSSSVVRAFRNAHACPATGRHDGPCAGWSVDHTVPLACGGCDAVFNMQWLPNAIKSCAGRVCKDRWELAVYCARKAP